MRPVHRARRLLEVTAAYEAHLAKGFPVTLDDIAETLQVSRDVDRTNWLTFLDICREQKEAGKEDDPSVFPLRTTANRNHAVTYKQGAATVRALRSWAGAAQANWWALKDAVRAADTGEALNAIDITQGWP